MAKNQKTKYAYETYLNNVGDSLSDENFIIGGKKRINNHNYGSLIRKYDPIAFNVGYKEWEKE